MKTKTSLKAGGKKGPMNGLRMRIVGKTIAVAIGIAVLVGVGGVDRASAITVTTSGCSGALSAPKTAGEYFYGDTVTMNKFYLYRASCFAETQTITVTYRMWHLVPGKGWVFDWSLPPTSVTLPPNQAYGWVHFNGAYYLTSNDVAADATITWTNTSTGKVLGKKVLNYNQVGDYICQLYQGYRLCAVQSDPGFGAYIHFFF
jgi:hypothetical protein